MLFAIIEYHQNRFIGEIISFINIQIRHSKGISNEFFIKQ